MHKADCHFLKFSERGPIIRELISAEAPCGCIRPTGRRKHRSDCPVNTCGVKSTLADPGLHHDSDLITTRFGTALVITHDGQSTHSLRPSAASGNHVET